MIKTITIDVINEKVLNILRDLELMQLIRMRKEESAIPPSEWSDHYKGAMSKQSQEDIDNQLNELRSGWE
ncbi:MAG: hypothetical protein ACK5XV_04000 [Flavobacteriales bacterium]|jgi:hypothetical protein